MINDRFKLKINLNYFNKQYYDKYFKIDLLKVNYRDYRDFILNYFVKFNWLNVYLVDIEILNRFCCIIVLELLNYQQFHQRVYLPLQSTSLSPSSIQQTQSQSQSTNDDSNVNTDYYINLIRLLFTLNKTFTKVIKVNLDHYSSIRSFILNNDFNNNNKELAFYLDNFRFNFTFNDIMNADYYNDSDNDNDYNNDGKNDDILIPYLDRLDKVKSSLNISTDSHEIDIDQLQLMINEKFLDLLKLVK